MSDEDEKQSETDENEDDRMGRANRIRTNREGLRNRRSRSADDQPSDEDGIDTTEQSEQRSQPSQQSQPSQSSQPSQTSQTSQRSQRSSANPQKEPVKQRPHRTVYLPTDLNSEFERRIDRLLFEAKQEEGVKLGKNRHAYPLIVYLGLEQANNMTTEEMLRTLEETAMLDAPET